MMEARLSHLEQLFANLSLGGAMDLTLAAGLNEWNGAKAGRPIHEFLEQLQQFAKISQWSDSDMVNITLSKLSGEAPTFLKGLNERELRGNYLRKTETEISGTIRGNLTAAVLLYFVTRGQAGEGGKP
jgi:hypothetical protein